MKLHKRSQDKTQTFSSYIILQKYVPFADPNSCLGNNKQQFQTQKKLRRSIKRRVE